MDFVRFLHGPLLSTFGALIVLFVVSVFVLKTADETAKPTIRKVRNWMALSLVCLLAWFAFSAATVNVVPRAVIDRSVANERADVLEQQGKEAKEAAKKAAAEKKGEVAR